MVHVNSGGFPGSKTQKGTLEPAHWKTLKHRRYSHTYFGGQPICALASNGYTLPSGTYAVENVAVQPDCIGSPLPIYYSAIGTQTLARPQFVASQGLNFGGDQTNGEGFNIVFGGPSASNRGKHTFTIGTDKAFFAVFKGKVQDVSQFSELAFGFRKAETVKAAIDNYDELACVNIQAGVYNIETILNGGTTDTVDTTLTDLADAGTFNIKLVVRQSGLVQFLINDANPTVSKYNFSFDSGEVVQPFGFILNGNPAGGYVYLTEFQCGYVAERGE